MQLEGKRIIVTGGSQGMGAATVRAYAQAGAAVAVVDVNEEAARARIAELDVPVKPVFCRADISKRAEVDVAFDQAAATLGGLDVLANVAGVQRGMAAEDFDDDDLEFLLGINLRGTILTNQAAHRHMRHNGYGSILNFGSDAALLPLGGAGAYAASKGGVMAWTRAVAVEWGPLGIRVNSIVPAIVTPMTDAAREVRADLFAGIPLGGLGDPDQDYAPVMVFMASENARFITGQIICCNGGMGMVR